VITDAAVPVSDVFIVDISSTIPVESQSPKATLYDQIPFSFFTVNDTIDLTTGAVYINLSS
jgi:hypothetical protein